MRSKRKSKTGSEKRKAERFSIPCKIEYRLAGKRGNWERVWCQDISGGGAGLFVKKPLKPMDKLDMRLYISGNNQPIYIACAVKWCSCAKKNKFRIGLQFIKIKEHSLFMNSLCEKMLELALKF